MSYTLTYSEAVKGWVSFYSFDPDWIIGMNNYLYTFKGGDIYRHNVNETRNTFYEQWWEKVGTPSAAFTSSRIKSVINDSPLENKLFKTIVLEGDSTWSGSLVTDLQNSGEVQSGYFERKEASFFSFIRNNSSGELSIRSTSGIGRSKTVTPGASTQINFSISPLISIGNMLSIGDSIYFSLPPIYNQIFFAGVVTNIIQNYMSDINRIVVNTTVPNTVAITTQDPYILYTKNSIAESHGVLGHYCVFDFTNGSAGKIELFSVGSDVMKSYP
jgi:hypothetical protein